MTVRTAVAAVALVTAAAVVTLGVRQHERGAGQSRAGTAGVTIELPRGWSELRFAVPPTAMRIDDPVTRIVAASGPVELDGRGCGEFAYTISPEDVGVVVVEWIGKWPGFGFPPRPRRFSAAMLPIHRPPALECWPGPGGGIEFADHGRRLAVYVLVGRQAPPELADRARAVLGTLRAEPRD